MGGFTRPAGRGYRVFVALYPVTYLVLSFFAGGEGHAARGGLAAAALALAAAWVVLSDAPRHLAYLAPGAAAALSGLSSLGAPPFVEAGYLFGATLVGATVGAMVFGHWYFVRPRLNPALLVAVADAAVLLALLRAVFFVAGIASRAPWPAWVRAEAWLAGGFGDPMVALVRALVGGVLLPAVLAGAARCARIGAVQPATGMLYAAVFFAVFAELSAFVLLSRGIPA